MQTEKVNDKQNRNKHYALMLILFYVNKIFFFFRLYFAFVKKNITLKKLL